jgi:hypothetical protein
MMPSETNPATGCCITSINGRKLIRTSAIAASEPSKPARGTIRRIVPERGAAASLKRPLASSVQMPMCQALCAAASSSRPSLKPALKAGPSTKNTMPSVLGVSIPRGMAVMPLFPVVCANRMQMHVKIKSPTSTPTAVPGSM